MANRKVSVAEARASLKDIVETVQRGYRVAITRYGKVAAYVISAADAEALDACKDQIESWRKQAQRREP
jgi:prevent-host-death family protein